MKNLTVAVLDNITGKWVKRDIPHTLDAFQEIVGGDIEQVNLPEPGVILYCNEDGKHLGLKTTAIWMDMATSEWIEQLSGPLVATGPVEGEDETDFNDEALAALERHLLPVIFLGEKA